MIESPVVTDLRRQEAEIASQAAEIKVRYGPEHPKTKRVMEQLADLDGRIKQEESRVTTSLNSTGMAGGFGTSRRTTIGQGSATGAAQGALGSTMRSPGDPMGRAMIGATGGSTLGGSATSGTGSHSGHVSTATGGAASGTTGGL